jgi:hypothetical protein
LPGRQDAARFEQRGSGLASRGRDARRLLIGDGRPARL